MLAGLPIEHYPRNSRKDLLDLLEAVEDAYIQGAIIQRSYNLSVERAGRRLVDSLLFLRKCWP